MLSLLKVLYRNVALSYPPIPRHLSSSIYFKHTIIAEFMVNLVDRLHFLCGLCLTGVISNHVHHAAMTQEGRKCPFKKKKEETVLSASV